MGFASLHKLHGRRSKIESVVSRPFIQHQIPIYQRRSGRGVILTVVSSVTLLMLSKNGFDEM
jgi:hypothetical protein